MYQALYRKYRPSNFNNVVGQEIVVTTLKNSIINNKIGHAYLFSGPRGTGKTSIAKIYAKTLNCLNIRNGVSCDECDVCTNTENLDIIEIDAASNNGIDEIREIKNKVNLTPTIGKYKIYIIDEVHMLTTGAFNALLKTLEEPPAHAIFILATTESQKIPATILSRCQRFDFKKISDKDMKERLMLIAEKEKIIITEDAIEEIVNNSDGGLRDSINLLDQVSSFKQDNIDVNDIKNVTGNISNENIEELIKIIKNDESSKLYEIVDQFYNDGKDTKKICSSFMNYMKNCLLYKMGISKSCLCKYDILNEYDKNTLINIITLLNNEINDIEKNDDKKFALFLLLLKTVPMFNVKIISSEETNIIKKLEDKIISHENKNNKIDSVDILKENINDKNDKDCVRQEKNENIEQIKQLNEQVNEEKNDILNTNDLSTSYDEFKKLRIDNTLSHFSKKILLDMKNKIENMDMDIFDQENYDVITILKDGMLKAASEEYLIFMYKTELTSQNFNENVEKYEKYLLEILDVNIKVISICENEWNVIKNEFNNKTREFVYRKEEK